MSIAAGALGPFRLTGAAATDMLGAALGPALCAGDVVGLSGPLGAGKSALARAAIGARLAAEGRAEETPSPSYTLVQTYALADLEIWHADLHRLAAPEEAVELDLVEAFDAAICLIEWIDRLGPLLPPRRLELRLDIAEEGAARDLWAQPVGSNWDAALDAMRRVLTTARPGRQG